MRRQHWIKIITNSKWNQYKIIFKKKLTKKTLINFIDLKILNKKLVIRPLNEKIQQKRKEWSWLTFFSDKLSKIKNSWQNATIFKSKDFKKKFSYKNTKNSHRNQINGLEKNKKLKNNSRKKICICKNQKKFEWNQSQNENFDVIKTFFCSSQNKTFWFCHG